MRQVEVRSLPGQLPWQTQPPPQTSLFQLKQQSEHFKEDLRHLSQALTVFSVHPVRIYRNLELYNNMEHQAGRMSFPPNNSKQLRRMYRQHMVEISSRSAPYIDLKPFYWWIDKWETFKLATWLDLLIRFSKFASFFKLTLICTFW